MGKGERGADERAARFSFPLLPISPFPLFRSIDNRQSKIANPRHPCLFSLFPIFPSPSGSSIGNRQSTIVNP